MAEFRESSAAGETGHDPYAALRIPGYRRYALANGISLVGQQMFYVAIGWELYQRTNSATALGLMGLCQVAPMFVLVIPGGHLVDRVNRKWLIIINQLLLVLSLTLLASAALFHNDIPPHPLIESANSLLEGLARLVGDQAPHFVDRHIPFIFLLLFVNGCIRSVNQPARQAIVPQLVPAQVFPNAVTWNSSVFEISTVTGPMLGGALLGWILRTYPDSPYGYPAIYFLTAVCQLVQALVLVPIKLIPMQRSKEPVSLDSLLAGFRYVKRTKVILASISLDLFAVLLGGAAALLPMIAKEILHVGPLGLGILRSAPSLGAVTMALTLAHRSPMRHAGRNMLVAVVGFGAATIVFGLSESFWLSFLMLYCTGLCDNISVVVRHTLVQILTPNEMRGRVSAVNSIFISSSNELGALESGLTAAWFGSLLGSAAAGASLSVVTGGIGTIMVAAVIAYKFPALRRIGTLQNVSLGE